MTDPEAPRRDILAELGGLRRGLDALSVETSAAARALGERESADREGEALRHREALAAIEATHAADSANATEACREAMNAAEERRRTERARIGTEAEDLRKRIQRKAVANQEAAEEALEEAIWLAESVFEAGEGKPREEYEKRRAEVATMLEEVEKLERLMNRETRRYRQTRPRPTPLASHDRDEAELAPIETIRSSLPQLRDSAAAFRRLKVAWLFRGPIFILPAAVLVGLAVLVSWLMGRSEPAELRTAGFVGGGIFLLVFILLYFLARREVRAAWAPFAAASARVQFAGGVAEEAAAQRRHQLEEDMEATRDRELEEARRRFGPIGRLAKQKAAGRLKEIERRLPLNLERVDTRCREEIAGAEAARDATLQEVEATRVRATGAELDRHEAAEKALDAELRQGWTELRAAWCEGVERRVEDLTRLGRLVNELHPPFERLSARDWTGAGVAPDAIRLGSLRFDRSEVGDGLPAGNGFENEHPVSLEIPAVTTLPLRASLHLDVAAEDRETGLDLLRTAMLRILTTVPPGKVRFTILDPVGLGQNFAGFMHLEDELPGMVGERIWTEPRQIEQRLVDLTEHMETVIQKYLRNEFATIDDYNAEAGEIAEPYRFLVVADFPANFSDDSARRLASIIQSGPRCGVFTLILRDRRLELPERFDPTDLERHAISIRSDDGRLKFDVEGLGDLEFTPDRGPEDALLIDLARVVGQAARDAVKVEVPFSTIAPAPEEFWTRSATNSLQVALGRAGATRLQEIVLGTGTAQHALVAGKTGSGKSTLLHALITNLACWHSPDEVELHLVDFKKGVEFKTYATHRLPHLRSVAVESDREFGVSVLKGLDRQLSERGDLFRAAGIQDLAGWRTRHPDRPMPRILLVIDEFQELFVDDDEVSQEASLLLDRLVRQGRAFGMHVLLGSQTLGGAYSLNRSTMGQMGVRIALACNEQDSMLILSDDNVAARLLSRPGEAIYNDQGGLLEGNSPFQVCWLPDQVREGYLARVGELVEERGIQIGPQIVFEGNAPAILAENPRLRELIETRPVARPPAVPLWLGDAVAIKDPTAAMLRRQSGSNVAIVGQQDELTLATTTAAIVGVCAAHARDDLQVVVLDGTPADDPNAGYLDAVAEHLPHRIDRPDFRGSGGAIEELGSELARRIEEGRMNAPTVLLMIHGLQRFRVLRRAEDDFGFSTDDAPPTPDRVFGEILREGPEHGIFVVTWADTVSTLERAVDRNTMRTFDQRVLFQIGATDSSTLIDSPAASLLGPNRGLLHSDERGTIEKFRPWALPSLSYLAGVGRAMIERENVGE